MTADEVKRALLARHPGHAGQMPGPWTAIEEYRGIDLVAFSAWQSAGRYARVGYEVKVSRSDLRRELLTPWKRKANVAWCNEFYFAVPAGLMTADELAYSEPDWLREHASFERKPCPNPGAVRMGKRGHGRYFRAEPPDWRSRWETCETCGGLGYVEKSRAEREAPTVWVPADVGLVVVDGRGTRVVKPSPRRRETPALDQADVGILVRWVSMRPDRRHHPVREASVA